MPRRSKRWPLPALAAGALLATAACGGGGGDNGFERADADTALDVTLADFAFRGLPASVKGERVYFTATNVGPSEHELEVLDPGGEAVDEIEAHPAGTGTKTLAVRLKPGTYTLQCILTTPEGKSHADLGMTAKLQVQ